MIEGPEAWERFQGAMRAAIAVPKSAVLEDERKRARARKKKQNRLTGTDQRQLAEGVQ
jgi:hypothetical protein